MVAALREMQENQRFSEIRIDKLEFGDFLWNEKYHFCL